MCAYQWGRAVLWACTTPEDSHSTCALTGCVRQAQAQSHYRSSRLRYTERQRVLMRPPGAVGGLRRPAESWLHECLQPTWEPPFILCITVLISQRHTWTDVILVGLTSSAGRACMCHGDAQRAKPLDLRLLWDGQSSNGPAHVDQLRDCKRHDTTDAIAAFKTHDRQSAVMFPHSHIETLTLEEHWTLLT